MKQNLRFYLKNRLTKKELGFVPSSFDVVGDILIFSDFPKELARKEKIIGQTILDNYRNIKAVLKKTKKYSGKFRTPKLKMIAGENKKEAVCRENNVFIKLDAENVYFSPRMSSERKRIAGLVKPNESVLVMFNGCSPYSLVIAKNTKCKEVYGIEINPIAHNYALENVKKNRLEHKIRLFLGDARKIMAEINKKFDRILMPLPKGGEDYLGLALERIKKKGVIHFYDFEHEDEFEKSHEKIRKSCIKLNKKYKILNIVKCGQYAPGFYRICVDFQVN